MLAQLSAYLVFLKEVTLLCEGENCPLSTALFHCSTSCSTRWISSLQVWGSARAH